MSETRLKHTDAASEGASDAAPCAEVSACPQADAAEGAPVTEAAPAPSAPPKASFKGAFQTALPIMLGYFVLGVPCGILCAAAGMDAWMVFVMSLLFYSGAGEYMLANMWLAGNPIGAIIVSVSLVSTRQMLYGASLSQFCGRISKRLAFIYGATVTDETFGVNFAGMSEGRWGVAQSLFVNLLSLSSWVASTTLGTIVGAAVSFPTALASFAMTSLFICLLCMQKLTKSNVAAAIGAIVGVVVCKCIGLSGIAILAGSLVGVACALVCSRNPDGNAQGRSQARDRKAGA